MTLVSRITIFLLPAEFQEVTENLARGTHCPQKVVSVYVYVARAALCMVGILVCVLFMHAHVNAHVCDYRHVCEFIFLCFCIQIR